VCVFKGKKYVCVRMGKKGFLHALKVRMLVDDQHASVVGRGRDGRTWQLSLHPSPFILSSSPLSHLMLGLLALSFLLVLLLLLEEGRRPQAALLLLLLLAAWRQGGGLAVSRPRSVAFALRKRPVAVRLVAVVRVVSCAKKSYQNE